MRGITRTQQVAYASLTKEDTGDEIGEEEEPIVIQQETKLWSFHRNKSRWSEVSEVSIM